MKKLLIFSLMLASFIAPAGAQVPPAMPRMITVSGEAEEQVAPDQAALTLSLVSKDADLAKAKKHNDEMVEKLVKIIRQFEIPKEKVATSNLYIAPEYSYPRSGKPQFENYNVSRTLRVTIDKIEIHERLLSAFVDAKVDQINGVEFLLKDRESMASKVRVKAFENAKARAQALADAAGSKLGQALSISTDGAMQPPMPPRPMMMKMAMAEAAQDSSVAPSLPGMITLHESVSVSFALE